MYETNSRRDLGPRGTFKQKKPFSKANTNETGSYRKWKYREYRVSKSIQQFILNHKMNMPF